MLVPRWASLVLISSQGVTNWGFRNALPSWLPLLAVSLNLSDAQRALLMSSFFPGYLLTQVPGSWAIQRYGAAQSFPNLLVGVLFFFNSAANFNLALPRTYHDCSEYRLH